MEDSSKAWFSRTTFAYRALRIALFVAGIILPVAALATEMSTRLCSSVFFDPIPGAAHMLLVAFVPIANFFVWRRSATLTPFLSVANGIAVGIASVYTLVFMPVMPVAAMYTLMSAGAFFLPAFITVLPFAPLASGVSAFAYGRGMSRGLRIVGAFIGILCFVAAEAPRSITRIALLRLEQDQNDVRAIRMLRNWGDTDGVLQAAYGMPSASRDMLSWVMSINRSGTMWYDFDDSSRRIISPEQARMVFYRVTGKSFNAVSRPSSNREWGWFGNDTGGNTVGERSDKVSLISSTVDGSVSAATLTSYTEWIMEFKNDDPWRQEEARAEIALPPGGVVTRVTLWINDQEVEALLGSRAAARAAYESVVSRKRDPLLVTTAGPDRILVQCFPIPPVGGKMKIRLGITAPLVPLDGQARLHLPALIERNFTISPSMKHAVWIESRTQIRSIGPVTLEPGTNRDVAGLRGEIPAVGSELAETFLSVEYDAGAGRTLSLDDDQLITQELTSESMPGTNELVIVLSGTAAARPYRADIVNAMKGAAAGKTAAVLLSGDETQLLTSGFTELDKETMEALTENIRKAPFVGGSDDALALRTAAEIADRKGGVPIVWIHAGQPIRSPKLDALEQLRRRSHRVPRIFAIELERNPNHLAEQLETLGFVNPIPAPLREQPLVKQLSAFISGAKFRVIRRTATPVVADQPLPPSIKHLNRLWGADRVQELLRDSIGKKKDDETELRSQALVYAARYRLVTPVSGAVVLEQADTAAAIASGLEQAQPGTIPAIPEPEMAVLFAALAALAVFHSVMTRRCHARH